jgi:transcriptional regulator with XRE-family HTH domain
VFRDHRRGNQIVCEYRHHISYSVIMVTLSTLPRCCVYRQVVASIAMMATRRIEPGPVGRRVALNLAALRIARRLSQPELARRIAQLGRPMTAPVVSKTEQLDRRVDVDDLVTFAVALDTTPNRLLLPGSADESETDLTPAVRVPALDAWEWATGEHPLLYRSEQQQSRRPEDLLGQLVDYAALNLAEVALDAFRQENQPHAPGEAPLDDETLVRHYDVIGPVLEAATEAMRRGLSAQQVRRVVDLAKARMVWGLDRDQGE